MYESVVLELVISDSAAWIFTLFTFCIFSVAQLEESCVKLLEGAESTHIQYVLYFTVAY